MTLYQRIAEFLFAPKQAGKCDICGDKTGSTAKLCDDCWSASQV